MRKESLIRQVWHFIWESDSPWSWIVDLILALIIVKFIFFPLLALIFNSALPMVVVESTSMLHEKNFDGFWATQGGWYEDNGISKQEFEGFSLINGFDKGDIMVINGKSDYNVGDVIVFRVPSQSTPIIHRIINETGVTYSTKGDHNPYQLVYEKEVNKSQVIGKAVGKIPVRGWLKLFFFEILRAF